MPAGTLIKCINGVNGNGIIFNYFFLHEKEKKVPCVPTVGIVNYNHTRLYPHSLWCPSLVIIRFAIIPLIRYYESKCFAKPLETQLIQL